MNQILKFRYSCRLLLVPNYGFVRQLLNLTIFVGNRNLRFWSKARFHSSTVVDACCWCLSTSCSHFELRRTFCKWLAAVSALVMASLWRASADCSNRRVGNHRLDSLWLQISLLLLAASPTLASTRVSWRGKFCEEPPLQDRGLPGGVPIDTGAGMSSTSKLLRLALRARITTRNHLRRREAGGGNLPRKGITNSGLITWIYRSTTKNRTDNKLDGLFPRSHNAQSRRVKRETVRTPV